MVVKVFASTGDQQVAAGFHVGLGRHGVGSRFEILGSRKFCTPAGDRGSVAEEFFVLANQLCGVVVAPIPFAIVKRNQTKMNF